MSARPETFRSSGGLVFGTIAVVGLLVLAVLAAVHPDAGAPAWFSAALVLLAVAVYVAQVRPAVVLDESELVLRNMLESVHLPWAAIEGTRVRQFLTVRAGERDYTCAAIGRSRRQIHKDAKRPDDAHPSEVSFGRFVEARIQSRAEAARAAQGSARRSPEHEARVGEVRRERAWPEIVVLVGSVLALVVTILVEVA